MKITLAVLFIAVVILLCVFAEKFAGRIGMPALILFMFIGILFGSDGIFKIPFNNYELAEEICSIALIFIMFYGGFNLKWKMAKSVAAPSVVLSTAGVLLTALLTCVLCQIFLKLSFWESFLIGAVLASTDAASVFSILRQKKLNLKDGTASILEMESGSNDPLAYTLTFIAVGYLTSQSVGSIPLQITMQIVFGILFGAGIGLLSVAIMTKTKLIAEGIDTIFLIAMLFLCFSLTKLCHGNEYLSVYLMGIIVGNSSIKNKNTIIPFFDGITSLAQILIFFLLGLLAFPHRMLNNIFVVLFVALLLIVIVRPIVIFLLLKPFRCSNRQCLLISWAGLRGASSSVFAIMAIAGGAHISIDLFHVVFMVNLLSVSLQGTLLPNVAKKLDMIDESDDVRKTFNDYQEESAITLMRMYIPQKHNWANKKVKDICVPTGSLALMIKRDEETIITKGDTVIRPGDNVILSVPSYEPSKHETLEEISIDKAHPWCGKAIHQLELAPTELIAMIIRGNENVIPSGNTMILENDIVVTYH